MLITEILPLLAALGLVAFMLTTARGKSEPGGATWMFPAMLSLAFLIFSLITIINEGLLGFWAVHTFNLWGNQVWFDLLIAVGIGWVLILPRARALGMNLIPWMLFIVCTGCIGLLAMVARVLYLGSHVETQDSMA